MKIDLLAFTSYAIAVVLALTVSGCSWFSKEDPIVVNNITMPVCYTEPPIDNVVMREVKFTIVKDSLGNNWFAVPARGYENLSLNVASMLQNSKQKNAVITYYRECLAENNQKDIGNGAE